MGAPGRESICGLSRVPATAGRAAAAGPLSCSRLRAACVGTSALRRTKASSVLAAVTASVSIAMQTMQVGSKINASEWRERPVDAAAGRAAREARRHQPARARCADRLRHRRPQMRRRCRACPGAAAAGWPCAARRPPPGRPARATARPRPGPVPSGVSGTSTKKNITLYCTSWNARHTGVDEAWCITCPAGVS